MSANYLVIDSETGDMGAILPHSLMGDVSATASRQSAVSGQFTDARLTMKGQDAGRRSMNIAEMLGLGRAPHFQMQTSKAVVDDFLKIHQELNAANDNGMAAGGEAPRPDTELLRAFASDLESAAPMLQEVAQILASGDRDGIKLVSKIAQLHQALNNPQATQNQIEAILEAIADVNKDRPDLLAENKHLNKFVRTLVAQAVHAFPSARMEALAGILTKPNGPQDMLDQSVEAMIEALKAVAADEDLSQELRDQAEELIEALTNLPEGEAVPIELFQKLETMRQSLEGTRHEASFGRTAQSLRTANILFKSHKFGLPVPQIHKMESLISQLGALNVSLSEAETEAMVEQGQGLKRLTTRLEQTIQALDKNPLSVSAFAGLSVLGGVLKTPSVQSGLTSTIAPVTKTQSVPAVQQAVQSIAQQVDVVSAIQAPIITHAPAESPQVAMLKQNLGIDQTIATVTQSLQSALPQTSIPVQPVLASVEPVVATVSAPVAAAVATLNNLTQTVAQTSQTMVLTAAQLATSAPAQIAMAAKVTVATLTAVMPSTAPVQQPVPPTQVIDAIAVKTNSESETPPPPPVPEDLDTIAKVDFSAKATDEKTQKIMQAMDNGKGLSLTKKFNMASSPIAKVKVLVTHVPEKVMEFVKGCGACVSGACAGCKISFNKAMMNIKNAIVGAPKKEAAPTQAFTIKPPK